MSAIRTAAISHLTTIAAPGMPGPVVSSLHFRSSDAPEEFPSPFDQLGPHPLAERAARRLMVELKAGAAGILDEGKMFGVLVVRGPGGHTGYLRAFSGTIGGRFHVPGFVPPVFDREAREAIEIPGEHVVKELTGRAWEFAASSNVAALLREKALLVKQQNADMHELRDRQAVRRRERRHTRLSAAADDPRLPALLHELSQQSRGDKAERRALEAAQTNVLSALDARLTKVERRLAAHARLQRTVSRRLMQHIHDTYRLTSAAGETRRLRDLFAPSQPPGGAGDCAGPKLIAYAIANGLEPIAMAEFWWGPPPPSGGRVAGAFYPSCREKCGPILPFLLEGLRVSTARTFVPPDASLIDLPILFQDEWIVVVDKPPGLLSVPPRSGTSDSVLARLESVFPGVKLAHRLDLDTSGVLVAARDARTYSALQRQFLRRLVVKRYVAIVEGSINEDEGTIELAIRVDVNDRPRHIHDPVHGRWAITRWSVLERMTGRLTRVALFPMTGRTHQLRVHASHPLGLAASIVGDRLYGREADRLLLHAESIEFDHPATGARILIESPAPF
jgi:tRNA pseudouridine32 synthase / 23S rRNA pseudouridine746 synthase